MRVSGTMFCMVKMAKQARQRYSLTILTVIDGLKININLQFQVLFRFYLNDFSLSKIFILFQVERKFVRVWHTFCCALEKTGTVTQKINSVRMENRAEKTNKLLINTHYI